MWQQQSIIIIIKYCVLQPHFTGAFPSYNSVKSILVEFENTTEVAPHAFCIHSSISFCVYSRSR